MRTREKQLREISQLLAAAPIIVLAPGEIGAVGQSNVSSGDQSNHGSAVMQNHIELPSVPVDDLLDDHSAELAEVRRWASSDAGQVARMQNPAGFANVRAHAMAHQMALGRQGARAVAAKAIAQAPAAS